MRPDYVKDEHLQYLDMLRESGVTNMFGAGVYLDEMFPELADGKPRPNRSSKKARDILTYWMQTFGDPNR